MSLKIPWRTSLVLCPLSCHSVFFTLDEGRSSSLRGPGCDAWKASTSSCLSSMKGGLSALRGQRCEVWKASTSLYLESVKRSTLRRAITNPRHGRLPLRRAPTHVPLHVWGGHIHCTRFQTWFLFRYNAAKPPHLAFLIAQRRGPPFTDATRNGTEAFHTTHL